MLQYWVYDQRVSNLACYLGKPVIESVAADHHFQRLVMRVGTRLKVYQVGYSSKEKRIGFWCR